MQFLSQPEGLNEADPVGPGLVYRTICKVLRNALFYYFPGRNPEDSVNHNKRAYAGEFSQDVERRCPGIEEARTLR